MTQPSEGPYLDQIDDAEDRPADDPNIAADPQADPEALMGAVVDDDDPHLDAAIAAAAPDVESDGEAERA